MSLDPASFYALAGGLFESENADEAVYRTVVGRAYYAAFLAARNQAGIQTRTVDVHDKTKDHYLTRSKSAIANRLGEMRIARNDADYDCQATIGKSQAGKNLKLARLVLVELGALTES